MTQTTAIVVFAVTTPFWLFQVSVVIFILYCRYRKRESYCTSFFLLFTLLCILDSFGEFVGFIGQRLINFPIVHPFYLSSPTYSSLLYLYSGYSLYTQCLLHLFIAINRIWNVYSILAQVPLKLGKFGKIAIIVVPFLPIPLLIPRFFHTAVYYVNADGGLSLKYIDTSIQKYQSTASACVLFFTAVPTFVFEIVTIFKYRQLLQNVSGQSAASTKKFYQEYRLVCQALIVLVIQVIVCFCQAFVYIATSFRNTTLFSTVILIYVYIGDVLNLIGPVALIVVSSHVRRDYIQFWLSLFGLRKEAWSPNKYGHGLDLYAVAVHEIGHALGLKHSTEDSAIMAPFYQKYTGSQLHLHRDDINAMRMLYGSGENLEENEVLPVSKASWIPPPDLCNGFKLDGVTTLGNGTVLAFIGEWVYTLSKSRSFDASTAKRIDEAFPDDDKCATFALGKEKCVGVDECATFAAGEGTCVGVYECATFVAGEEMWVDDDKCATFALGKEKCVAVHECVTFVAGKEKCVAVDECATFAAREEMWVDDDKCATFAAGEGTCVGVYECATFVAGEEMWVDDDKCATFALGKEKCVAVDECATFAAGEGTCVGVYECATFVAGEEMWVDDDKCATFALGKEKCVAVHECVTFVAGKEKCVAVDECARGSLTQPNSCKVTFSMTIGCYRRLQHCRLLLRFILFIAGGSETVVAFCILLFEDHVENKIFLIMLSGVVSIDEPIFGSNEWLEWLRTVVTIDDTFTPNDFIFRENKKCFCSSQSVDHCQVSKSVDI
uniref:ZnMc domain-containing protein n=1 Tax=Panagrellus redivivus TaxID=6233 RepID=A0A7E4WCY9_PANRE